MGGEDRCRDCGCEAVGRFFRNESDDQGVPACLYHLAVHAAVGFDARRKNGTPVSPEEGVRIARTMRGG